MVICIPVLLIGGTEMQTLTLANVLVLEGYRVTVCCYYEYDRTMVSEMEKTGAEVILLKHERSEGMWHLAKELNRVFRELDTDIVHVQYIAPGLIPIIAAKLSGIKTIFATVHQSGRIYGWKEKLLLRTAAQLCTAFFCVSRSVEESWFGNSELLDPLNFNKCRTHFTIYNAIDVDKVRQQVEGGYKEKLRSSFGLADKKVIGVVGRLRHEKGQELLLRAMPAIIEKIPGTMLVIVGDGPDREKLLNLSRRSGLDEHIIWLGAKSPDEVYKLYSIMDVVAVPSLLEGFGLVAIEAMAAGVPVAAARVDGLPEIIEEGNTGCLFPANDHNAMASSIIDILSDTAYSVKMGQEGRRRTKELFSFQIFFENTVSSYKSLQGKVL